MQLKRINHLVISTPEGISFSLLLAGPVTRFFAWGIDLACVSIVMYALTHILFAVNIINPDFGSAVLALVYFGVSIGYSILLEWRWRGQTLGKRLLKLRVIDEDGLRLRLNQVIIRNLLRFVDTLPAFYLLGGLACVFTTRSQRLGDIAASTVVVRSRHVSQHDSNEIAPEKYNSFRDYPHLVGRLRQRTDQELIHLAQQAVQRREKLEPRARIDLFQQIAARFKTIVKFPEEATFGLTDEQYVRNIVDSLFQKEDRKPSVQPVR